MHEERTVMMELVPIGKDVIGGETVQSVNARDLHAWLGSGHQFADWIKDRIQAYGFVENEDFTKSNLDFTNVRNQDHGGDRRSIDYIITIDMAKELSMVERNEKGKEARKYFIRCEKALNAMYSQARSIDRKEIQREVVSAVLTLQEWLKRTDRSYDWLKRLVRYRRVNGLYQWEVGKLLGCSRDTVQRNEKLLKDAGLWEIL